MQPWHRSATWLPGAAHTLKGVPAQHSCTSRIRLVSFPQRHLEDWLKTAPSTLAWLRRTAVSPSYHVQALFAEHAGPWLAASRVNLSVVADLAVSVTCSDAACKQMACKVRLPLSPGCSAGLALAPEWPGLWPAAHLQMCRHGNRAYAGPLLPRWVAQCLPCPVRRCPGCSSTLACWCSIAYVSCLAFPPKPLHCPHGAHAGMLRDMPAGSAQQPGWAHTTVASPTGRADGQLGQPGAAGQAAAGRGRGVGLRECDHPGQPTPPGHQLPG